MAFIDFSTIEDVKFDERNFLKTGIDKLDREIIGLGLGHLVIITGPRAGGKTTLTSQLVNNFIDRGYQGLMCSFEMSNARLKNWILLQALGAENLKAYTTSGGKEIYFPKNNFKLKSHFVRKNPSRDPQDRENKSRFAFIRMQKINRKKCRS